MFYAFRIQSYSPAFLAFSLLADALPALLEANFERGFLYKASCGLPRISIMMMKTKMMIMMMIITVVVV
jgi:hypothetical protein